MMNNISIYGVQGVDPMGAQDGLLSMLFEGGEGFSTVMDTALLSEEVADDSGLLTEAVTEQDGLSLMQSEMGGVLASFTIGAPTTPTMTTNSSAAGVSQDLSSGFSDANLSDADLGQLPIEEALSMDGVELPTQTLENAQFTVSKAQADVSTSQHAVGVQTHGPKGVSRKGASLNDPTEVRLDEVQTEREVSMEAREHKAMEIGEELDDWDSSHLQLDSEFEHVAANSPFSKAAQVTVTDNRVMVQADALEAADGDGLQEATKTDEKKAAAKVAEAQFDVEEFEENPADARVEISDQRTVRVVLDEDLSVEVNQDGDAIDVLVEGAQDVTNDIRETEPEIAQTLDDSGLRLRDFSTRQEGHQASQEHGQSSAESVNTETAEAAATNVVNRGHSVNIVA